MSEDGQPGEQKIELEKVEGVNKGEEIGHFEIDLGVREAGLEVENAVLGVQNADLAAQNAELGADTSLEVENSILESTIMESSNHTSYNIAELQFLDASNESHVLLEMGNNLEHFENSHMQPIMTHASGLKMGCLL